MENKMPTKTKGKENHKMKIQTIMPIKLVRVRSTFMGFQWPSKKDLTNNHYDNKLMTS